MRVSDEYDGDCRSVWKYKRNVMSRSLRNFHPSVPTQIKAVRSESLYIS